MDSFRAIEITDSSRPSVDRMAATMIFSLHWEYIRGAPDRKISVRPDNRTGLIEAGYWPDRPGLRKTKQAFTTERRNLFSLRHNLMNFDSQSQIQFLDAHSLFLS